jgi:hypothetical protein
MLDNVIHSNWWRQTTRLRWANAFQRSLCNRFGHEMDNTGANPPGWARRCRCGASFLAEDCSETRVRHILSCFFRGHTYARAGTRAGFNEYMCERCGHPLMFKADEDPYAHFEKFGKKVRYLCSLFGHRVDKVAEHDGLTEYSCHCGHSFLKPVGVRRKVTHPLTCFFAGHFVHFTERRRGYAEFLCRNCGHTFYLR